MVVGQISPLGAHVPKHVVEGISHVLVHAQTRNLPMVVKNVSDNRRKSGIVHQQSVQVCRDVFNVRP